MTRHRAAAAAVALTLLAAGCATNAENLAPPTAVSPARHPADAVVLRVSYIGGFTTATEILTRLPTITVYGDGRVITQGPQPKVFPGPALPSIELRRITPAGVDALVERALAAGVGTAADFGEPSVADLPSTRFTLDAGGPVRTTEVFALDETGAPGVTAAQEAARARLRSLVEALGDLPATLGAGSVGPATAYQPAALVAVARPWTAADPATDNQPEVAWPGPPLPGPPPANFTDLGCTLVTGAAAPATLDAARTANIRTPWRSGDNRWQVHLRPLLPDESDCADLGRRAG